MIKFSLNSPLKKLRFFLIFFLIFLIGAVVINILGTVILNQKIMAVKNFLRLEKKVSFGTTFAYFNVFRGVSIIGMTFSEDGRVWGEVNELHAGFDLFSVLQNKVRVKTIDIVRPHFELNKVSYFSGILSRLLDKAGHVGNKSFETVYIKFSGVNFNEAIEADVDGYFSYTKDNLAISRGKVTFKKISLPLGGLPDLAQDKLFSQAFDYIFEGESEGSDYIFSRLEFSNSSIKLSGEGKVLDFKSNPRLELVVELGDLKLEDISVLNQGHAKSRGELLGSLTVNGPFDNLRPSLSFYLESGYLNFFDSLILENARGTFLFVKDRFLSRSCSFDFNGMPLKAEIAIDGSHDKPSLALQLYSKLFAGRLLASFSDHKWLGDVNARIRYSSFNTINNIDLSLRNFRLGHDKDLFFNADQFKTSLSAKLLDAAEPRPIFQGALSFDDLFCVVRKQDNAFVLDYIKANGYGGTLDGRFNFTPSPLQLNIAGEAHLHEADLTQFFKNVSQESYSISGKINGDFRLDNSLSDMLKGQVFITRGLVTNHPLLNAVSDFLGVASLKKLAFDEMSMFFSGGRGNYASQIKLKALQINAFLEGNVSLYEMMDGYLSVAIATELLSESKQFKKILTYIRHDKPDVIFPFKISSYLSSPRILWLKNEFKDKLANLLPESNKRVMQKQVNDIVGKL